MIGYGVALHSRLRGLLARPLPMTATLVGHWGRPCPRRWVARHPLLTFPLPYLTFCLYINPSAPFVLKNKYTQSPDPEKATRPTWRFRLLEPLPQGRQKNSTVLTLPSSHRCLPLLPPVLKNA